MGTCQQLKGLRKESCNDTRKLSNFVGLPFLSPVMFIGCMDGIHHHHLGRPSEFYHSYSAVDLEECKMPKLNSLEKWTISSH